jgi:NADH dehydrogenase FAD-containing subunit
MVDEHLRVKGLEDVYAVGDVSDMEYSQILSCNRQSAYVAKRLGLILNNRPLIPYKAFTSRMSTLSILSLQSDFAIRY